MSEVQIQVHRDVFIVGAGFSHAISQAMPLMSSLAEAVDRVADALRGVPSTIVRAGRLNVESLMAYLGTKQPFLLRSEQLRNEAAAFDLTEAVVRSIRFAQNRALIASRTPPDWLMRLVWAWHLRRAAVLTLNYDTLVELAVAEVLGKEYPPRSLYPIRPQEPGDRALLSGDRKIPFSLMKLHGSISWRRSGGDPQPGAAVFDFLPRNASWSNPDETTVERLQDELPYLQRPLAIVPPTMDKGPFFLPDLIRDTWQHAFGELKGATRVFVLGYSLPEADLAMRWLLHAGLDRTDGQSSPSVLVVDINPNASVAIGKMLGRAVESFRSSERPVEDFAAGYLAEVQANPPGTTFTRSTEGQQY